MPQSSGLLTFLFLRGHFPLQREWHRPCHRQAQVSERIRMSFSLFYLPKCRKALEYIWKVASTWAEGIIPANACIGIEKETGAGRNSGKRSRRQQNTAVAIPALYPIRWDSGGHSHGSRKRALRTVSSGSARRVFLRKTGWNTGAGGSAAAMQPPY